MIEVIHAASRGTLVTRKKGVLTMVSTESKQDEQYSEKKKKYIQESIAFNDDDLEGITQPHNDAGSYR